jgi:4-hydroxyisophthalate hydroxylase
MIAGGILREREWLKLHNPERDLADFEKAWDELDRSQMLFDIEPNFEGSPIVVGSAPGTKPGIHSRRSFEARPGHHLAPQLLFSGRNIYEELGEGFTLLAFGVDDNSVAVVEEATIGSGVPLKSVRDDQDEERAKYESKLVLVRPDQFVAWADDRCDSLDEAKLLLGQATGH